MVSVAITECPAEGVTGQDSVEQVDQMRSNLERFMSGANVSMMGGWT